MGLPIAVGGKELSSRSIAPPQPIPDDTDGTVLEAVVVDCPPRIATAIDSSQKLVAVCSISYYDMMDSDDNIKSLMAEIRIQVSPLAQAFSQTYRSMLHRIPFPDSIKEETFTEQEETTTFVPLVPSVVFASDGKNLACLVPHPRVQQTMLVIFQLRKPRTTPAAVTLPRPSYLPSTSNTTTAPIVRVATNPVTTKLPNKVSLTKASAICNVQARSGALLLAACVDGSILVIAYRPAQVAGILHPGSGNDVITSITHLTESHAVEDGSRGKLVAIHSTGEAVLFSSHLVMSETADTMLMQLQKHYSLRGSYTKAVWMSSCFLALVTQPSLESHAACQVWPISFLDNGDSGMNTASSIESSEPIATLVMTTERLAEYAHGSFSLESAAVQTTQGTYSTSFSIESLESAMELQFDPVSNCLFVSSVVMTSFSNAIPFACVWHWRTNVVGLLLATRGMQRMQIADRDTSITPTRVWQIPMYSKLYYCRDLSGDGGSYLAHLVSDSARDWKSHHQNRLRKEVYALALLSPSETLSTQFSCQEPASLMVSSKCVTFPTVSCPFSGKDYEFTWKDARIPASYTTAFGSPNLACIGRKRCRSVAVASSKGMCVLDCSRLTIAGGISEFTVSTKSGAAEAIAGDDGTKTARIEQPKWRLFGNETDERTFRVLAMTWWEGSDDRKSGVYSDDLLVAVISVEDESKEEKKETLYLACWSPRRLDQTNQRMVRWRHSSKSRSSSSWGIRLPADFDPSSISLLSEPVDEDVDNMNGLEPNRRAVLLLGSIDDSMGETGNVNYQLYQLEVDSDGAQPDTDEAKYIVKAKLCSDGQLLESVAMTEMPMSGVFLASASFDFTIVKAKSSRNLKDNPSSGSKTFLATVGIVRSPCHGLESVLISTEGVDDRKAIISGSSEVSSFWHSHTIPSNPLLVDASKPVESFFVWSIELCNSNLVCWSVPYINGPRPRKWHDIRTSDVTEHASNVTGGSQYSMHGDGENRLHQSLFGSATSIGDSSSWIQETSVANRTGFSLGSIPSTPFGCILRSSQSGKDLHRFAPVENEDHGSAKDLDHEIFCLGTPELAPPALVPSLYASLVGRVEKVGSDPQDRLVSYTMDFSSSTVNAFTMLKLVDNEDTVLVSLRTLIVRIIELIARESDKMGNDISAQHSLFLLTATFADIVEAAKERLPPMQFVSLFLAIGRQIEPSCLTHLFPLPLSTPMAGDGQHKCRSVEDLFMYSIRHGCISVAASALPLFLSKRYSLKMCGSLIRHCLETFEENSDSPQSVVFDLSAEERRMLRGIFHFGVRIEDSGTMPPMEPVDELDPLLAFQTVDEGVDTNSLYSSASLDTSPDIRRTSQLLAAQRSSARICQMFAPSSILGQFQRPKEEEAIFDAASSFILSGFDEVKIGFESPSKSISSRRTGDSSVSSESGEVTMAGIIASFLLPLAFPTDGSKQKFRWKRTASLAQILLGDTSNDMDVTKIRSMTKLAESWSLDEIIFSLQISNSSLNNDFNAAEKEKWLVRLLKRHLVECGMMMSTAHATMVLRLVMLLLDRYSLGRDIKARSPGLLLLGIVVAHCAGHQRELLDARPRNKFTTSYATALNEIRNR